MGRIPAHEPTCLSGKRWSSTPDRNWSGLERPGFRKAKKEVAVWDTTWDYLLFKQCCFLKPTTFLLKQCCFVLPSSRNSGAGIQATKQLSGGVGLSEFQLCPSAMAPVDAHALAAPGRGNKEIEEWSNEVEEARPSIGRIRSFF